MNSKTMFQAISLLVTTLAEDGVSGDVYASIDSLILAVYGEDAAIELGEMIMEHTDEHGTLICTTIETADHERFLKNLEFPTVPC